MPIFHKLILGLTNIVEMNVIQIGSNKGNDDFTRLIKHRQNKSKIEKIILVEPLSVHHDALKSCYRGFHYIIEKIAITDDETTKELTFFYHINDGPGYEVASLSKEHILKHAKYNSKLTEDGIREEIVPCLSINQLFEKNSLADIDILFIDAEGYDDRIIKSINFNKYNVMNIIYENLHINNIALTNFLQMKGFNIQPKWGKNKYSSLAVNKNNNSDNTYIDLQSDDHFGLLTKFRKQLRKIKLFL